MERQRLAEWEKQRKSELMQHRQREQEKVLILKAKQEHINSDLEKLVNDMPCSFLLFVQAIMCLHLPANKEPLKRFFFISKGIRKWHKFLWTTGFHHMREIEIEKVDLLA